MAIEIQTEDNPRTWKTFLVHEMVEYFFNFAFLAMFLVAFAWYRRLILASYHIQYFGYWVPLIEAAVLAKIIMVGDALRIGRKFQNRSLAVITLYRTLVFGVLVALFSLLEHFVGAMIHGESLAKGLSQIAERGIDEMLARCVLIIAAFLPFFGFKEIERVIGTEKVRGMFFRGRADEAGDTATDTHDAPDKQPSPRIR